MQLIPLTVSEVDADWLTATLRRCGHRVTVTDCRHRAAIGGNATKVLVTVAYVFDDDANSDLPTDLCVKVGMELQDQTKNLTGSTYDIEGRFYLDVAPLLQPVSVPRCVAVAIDSASFRCGLVLEDLTVDGGAFGSPLVSEVRAEQVATLLEILARLHARWWAGKGSMPITGLERGIDPTNRLGRYYRTFDQHHLAGLLAGSRGAALPSPLHDPAALLEAFWSYAATTVSSTPCLIHADPHLANVYFRPDGTCGIADWQTLRWGSWAHDVAYLIGSSLTIEERRRSETDLLGSYLRALVDHGAEAPSFDAALRAYRAAFIYGLVGWLTAPSYFGYSEAFSSAYAHRFATAAVDHDTIAVITAR